MPMANNKVGLFLAVREESTLFISFWFCPRGSARKSRGKKVCREVTLLCAQVCEQSNFRRAKWLLQLSTLANHAWKAWTATVQDVFYFGLYHIKYWR